MALRPLFDTSVLGIVHGSEFGVNSYPSMPTEEKSLVVCSVYPNQRLHGLATERVQSAVLNCWHFAEQEGVIEKEAKG